MKIIKRSLADSIYKRLNGSLPKKYIYEAIKVICECLIDEISDNKSVSVFNFGTFSPFLFHGHKAYDVQQGRVAFSEPFWSVKFRIHSSFAKLLDRHRKNFERRKQG